MRVYETMFDEFFGRRLPDEGFTIEELYNDYFGLLHKAMESGAEMHGYVVTMDGKIIVPELKPSPASRVS